MSSNEERIIKIGDFISTRSFRGEKIEGKVISITELKNILWVSIKTPKGIRITKLNEV